MQISPQIKILENGLNVIYVPFPNMESLTIHLRGKAGSNYETSYQIGAAHFLEHMLLQGTKKYQESYMLKAVIQDVGGKIVCATSREDVLFMVKTLSKDLEKGFDFLSEIVINPLIPENKIEIQKKLIAQEIKRVIDHPEKYIGRLSYKILFPRQRFEKLNTGNLEDVEKITSEILWEFYKKNYIAQNFVLVICGNAEAGVVFDLAEKYFDQMSLGEENKILRYNSSKNFGICVWNKIAVRQSHLKIDFLGYPKGDKRRYSVMYISQAFKKAGFIENLKNVNGFSYIASSGDFATYSYGILGVYTACEEDNLNLIIKELKNEIKLLSTNLLSKENFDKIKNTLITEFIFDLEKVSGRADYFSDRILFNKENTNYLDEIEEIKKITREDVLRVAKEVFAQEPKITAITKSLKEEDIRSFWYNSV